MLWQINMPSVFSQVMLRRFILVTSLVLLLSACGFQLRGALNLSQDISPVYLQKNSLFELARELESLLKSNKIQITENEKQAKMRLELLHENKSQRVLSVDGSGRVKEYLLTYNVSFFLKSNRLNDADKKQKQEASLPHDSISPDSISVTRSLLFDANAAIAVVNESEILYKDMRRDVARLILLKLQAAVNNPQ